MPRTHDWLVAFDDGLAGRLRHCTQCGRDAGAGYFDILNLDTEIDTLSIGMMHCARCRAGDPQREALHALCRQRYGPAL